MQSNRVSLHSFLFVIHIFIPPAVYLSSSLLSIWVFFFAFCLFFPSSCPLIGMVDIPALFLPSSCSWLLVWIIRATLRKKIVWIILRLYFRIGFSYSRKTQCGDKCKDIEKMVQKAASGHKEKTHKLGLICAT